MFLELGFNYRVLGWYKYKLILGYLVDLMYSKVGGRGLEKFLYENNGDWGVWYC